MVGATTGSGELPVIILLTFSILCWTDSLVVQIQKTRTRIQLKLLGEEFSLFSLEHPDIYGETYVGQAF